MTRKELTKAVADRTGHFESDVDAILRAATDVMKETVIAGQSIYLRGFGTFEPKVRRAKKARNISRNTTIEIPERTEPRFRPCKEFKKATSRPQ